MLEVGESTALLNQTSSRVVGARREGAGEWMEEADGELDRSRRNTFPFFLFLWLHCDLSSPTRGSRPDPTVKALKHNPGPPEIPQTFFLRARTLLESCFLAPEPTGFAEAPA